MVDSLRLDEATHAYRLNGRRLWGVTDVLKAAGLLPDFGDERALARGRRIHQACHFLDEGDLQWESLLEEDEPYVRAWEKAKKELRLVVKRSEFHVVNKRFNYAGTPDALARRGPSRCVLERKTGDILPAAGLQLAAYGEALPGPKRATLRLAVALRADGSFSVKDFPLREYHHDFLVFLSALKMAEWKRRNL